MGKRLTLMNRIKEGYNTLDSMESQLRKLFDDEIAKHKVELFANTDYYIGLLQSRSLYVEFELTNIRPDVVEGKSYTEYIKILIDITDKDTELEDIAEDLAKVVRQFAVHGMLSSALERRFYSYYGEHVLIQIKQPELDIKGVRL